MSRLLIVLLLALTLGIWKSPLGVAEASAVLSVRDEDNIPGIKRSVVVRLSEPISEDALRSIAKEIKKKKPNFQRTFIVYLLPEMRAGEGAWATTHFNPNLKVVILGQRANDKTHSDLKSVNTLGHWIVPTLGYHIWIHERDEGFVIERKFKDGSGSLRGIIETKHSRGRRFDYTEKSTAGDHYIVTSKGYLEMRDELGLIDNLRPEKRDRIN